MNKFDPKLVFLGVYNGGFYIEVEGHKSSPVPYNGIAVLKLSDGRKFIGVSAYYKDQLKEGVHQVLEIDTWVGGAR